jgi:hypothetical protein
LGVHRINDVRQIELHTAEPLVLEPSPFEVVIAATNLKRYESRGVHQIPEEFFSSRRRNVMIRSL